MTQHIAVCRGASMATGLLGRCSPLLLPATQCELVVLAVAPWECNWCGDHQVMVACQDSHQDTAPSLLLPSLPFQMDPVQKAVISHTFGMPAPLKKKQFISCNICHLRFNSAVSGATDGAGRE